LLFARRASQTKKQQLHNPSFSSITSKQQQKEKSKKKQRSQHWNDNGDAMCTVGFSHRLVPLYGLFFPSSFSQPPPGKREVVLKNKKEK